MGAASFRPTAPPSSAARAAARAVPEPRLGLVANGPQFALLVVLNAFVGAMVGLERTVVPIIGDQEFGVSSSAALLAFVAAFGAAKAVANLGAGALADAVGRRRLLIAGWAVAIPIAPMVALAPSWGWIVAANVLLGVNQGFAWSMTVVMKIDLVGPRRRGLALGLNEAAGYGGVAIAALATGLLAASVAPRTTVWVGALVISAVGLAISVAFVRDTAGHVALEQRDHGAPRPVSLRRAFVAGTITNPVLRACSQAGLVNNANDAVVWGLIPVYMLAAGASTGEIAAVAAVYPAVWGLGQIGAGWASDHTGRKPLIVAGMATQAVGLAGLVLADGAVGPSVAAAALLGAGTALVYPTLLAATSDAVTPSERAAAIGVYRFWRDAGFLVGALLAGVAADLFGVATAIGIVAALTLLSGVVVWATRWPPARPISGSEPAQTEVGA